MLDAYEIAVLAARAWKDRRILAYGRLMTELHQMTATPEEALELLAEAKRMLVIDSLCEEAFRLEKLLEGAESWTAKCIHRRINRLRARAIYLHKKLPVLVAA